MDFSKYMNKRFQSFGDIISLLVMDLYNENKYDNILFVRTCTTGGWLDKLLVEHPNVTRILYYTDKIRHPTESHKATTIMHSNNLEKYLLSLNKTFDLICIDTWHEHNVSSRDFRIISSVLSDSGILVSHDCYPWNRTVANRVFIPGEWCGETYISFVEFAYNNPDLYYTILKTDTGIGIISKKEMPLLSNSLDRNKQEYLLLLHRHSKDYYAFFNDHSKDIINAIVC